MLEEVDDCGIYAPRILQNLVIDEEKNTELKIKPAEENSVFPAPKVKENDLEVDYSIFPITQNNNQKDLTDIPSPIVHKEVAEAENSVLLIEPSYELDTADSKLASPIKNKEKEATEQSVQQPILSSKEPEQGNTDSATPILHREEDIISSVMSIVHRDTKSPTAQILLHKMNTRKDVDSILSVLPKSSTNVYTPYNDSDYLEKLLIEENNEQRLGATAIHSAYDIHEDTEIFPNEIEFEEAGDESSARATECASSSQHEENTESDGTDSSSSSDSEDEDSSLTCTIVKMNGREYYSYFQMTKKRDHYTMYPRGKVVLPRGLVLHFSETTGMTREDIKGALLPLGAKIAFMDFEKGDSEGWVRLKDSTPAMDIIQKMTDSTIKINDIDVVFRVLKGKEEKKYLNRAGKGIAERRRDKDSLEKKLKKNGFKYVNKINN